MEKHQPCTTNTITISNHADHKETVGKQAKNSWHDSINNQEETVKVGPMCALMVQEMVQEADLDLFCKSQATIIASSILHYKYKYWQTLEISWRRLIFHTQCHCHATFATWYISIPLHCHYTLPLYIAMLHFICTFAIFHICTAWTRLSMFGNK